MDISKTSEDMSAAKLSTLVDIAHELSSIHEWQTRLQSAVSLVCDVFPSSTIAVGVQFEEWWTFLCGPHAGTRELDLILLQHYSVLTGEMRPILITHESVAGGRPIISRLKETGGSFVSMPIVGADQVLGLLHARSPEPDAYALGDISFFSVVASQIGSYLRNVHAYDEEVRAREQMEQLRAEAERRAVEAELLREQAEKSAAQEAQARALIQSQRDLLQLAMVPGEVIIGKGYDSSAVYIPAYGGETIGGDFYDVLITEDGKVGVLIGDVSGKGIQAAARAVATRSTVRAFAYDLSSPGPALQHANSVLYAQQPFGSFVTVFLAILDTGNGHIRYSSAGHPSPIIYRADGAMELLTKGGLPLGVLPDEDFPEGEASLGPGDKIIFFTDGLSEARHNSELFDMEGIHRVLEEYGSASAETISGELLAAAGGWAKGRLLDDTAVIVIGRNADQSEKY